MWSLLVYDWIAVVLFLITLISLLYKGMYKGLENKVFLLFLFSGFLCAVFDICMGICYRTLPITDYQQTKAYFFGYWYFIFRQITNLVYILFIFAVSGTWYKLEQLNYRIIFAVVSVIPIVYILSNRFTEQIFTVSLTEGYSRRPGMLYLYIFSVIVGIFGFIYLCFMRRYLGTGKWLAMASMYVFLGASSAYQYAHPGRLIDLFTISISGLLIHLLIQRPEEMYDISVRLYSEFAFREKIRRLTLTKRETTIFVIRFQNAFEVRNSLGEDGFIQYVKDRAAETEKLCNEYTKSFKVYFHPSGALFVVFEHGLVDLESRLPELIWMWEEESRNGYGSLLKIRLCSIRYPVDITDPEELFHFSTYFGDYMKDSTTFARGSVLLQERDVRICNTLPQIILRALQENGFELYYQPIYDLKKKQYRSAEALIRLHDPEYGLIESGMFIPEAEKRDLILPIGQVALDKTFAFAARSDFKELGLDYIELNLSVEHCLNPGLQKQIAAMEKKYHTRPERINIEITESMSGVETEAGFRNIGDLRNKGYTFSLDDYGTGFSNIMRAMELPISIVKIDKSICAVMDTPKGYSILAHTISMMHDAGFEIVCEGVETAEQAELLERLGCDYIQGYYYAKPMCEEEFVAFLKNSNRAEER
ncbi:MAG: EAL domain-containing protein [Lachnospiraceae bacterium]|nr:EAL domain-containing protein [Lachnospiraceae bacterium]